MHEEEQIPINATISDTSPESVNDDYDIDISRVSSVDQSTPHYPRLIEGEFWSIVEALKNKYPKEQVGEVNTLFRNMKSYSQEPSTSQTYEWLVHSALGCRGEIREGGAEIKAKFQQSGKQYDSIFRDWYRITQAFWRENSIPAGASVYRGLWKEEIVPILTMFLNEPFASSYEIDMNPVSSFSFWEHLSKKFSKGAIIEIPPSPEAVAFGADMLIPPYRSTEQEGEVHILTGALLLHRDRIRIHFKKEEGAMDPVNLTTTAQSMKLPEYFHIPFHENIREMLILMAEYYEELINNGSLSEEDYPPLETDSASSLVKGWLAHFRTTYNDEYSTDEMEQTIQAARLLLGSNV